MLSWNQNLLLTIGPEYSKRHSEVIVWSRREWGFLEAQHFLSCIRHLVLQISFFSFVFCPCNTLLSKIIMGQFQVSVAFLYVFLALVLQNNSYGSVLALLGKKKIPKHLWRKRHWCIVKYHKLFCLNISSWRLYQGQKLMNFMLQLTADCLRSVHIDPGGLLYGRQPLLCSQ